MIDEPTLPSRSRYLRLSVRGFIVLISVIGVGLGWVVRHAHFQREAVTAIRRAGGDVSYAWRWRDGRLIRNGEPWWPKWLVDLVGADFFGDITLVILNNPTDADMILAGNLKRLEAIILQGRVPHQVTNDGLATLSSLARLKQMYLDSTGIDDIGLNHISGLTSLRLLKLGSTKISDAGLKKLRGLTGLTHLDLSSTNITDGGLAELSGLVNVESLNLMHTGVTDAGLKHLMRMKRLTYLFVADTTITDTGLRQLQEVLPRVQKNQ